MELSDNARAVLLELYKQYLEKEDLDLPDADVIDPSFSETTEVFGEPKPNTVDKALRELHECGLVKLDVLGYITITERGIAFMDSSYHHRIDEVKQAIGAVVKLLLK